MPPVRLLVAASSVVARNRLSRTLSGHPSLTLIGTATDLSGTYTKAEAMEPQVVLVAQEFMNLPEWDCMRSLFYAINARWVPVLSVQPMGRPPADAVHPDMDAPALLAQVERALAMGRTSATPPTAASAGTPARLRRDRLILIGASTGGVDALLNVLTQFPVDCPPTAVVQHTGRSFSDGLIRLLERRCKATVVAARSGLVLHPGTICVAAGCEGHLRLTSGDPPRCTVTPGPLVSGHMPSVDELFHSALPMAPRVVAALMTGMGRDGALGLLELRRAGALTLAQDEGSSVVYGMPGAAWEMGAVQQRLPLSRIGAEILRACATNSEGQSVAR
jgi:two-component system chemotaxis response regulator CheB